MLTYDTTDIVKMATNLAGIEDINFMKHSTITEILNAEFASLYEMLIENDDAAFTKTIETSKQIIDLPKDFYRLRNVKNKDLDVTEYEIENNKLKFRYPGTYKIMYWYTPPTLTYPAEAFDIGDNEVSDAYGDRIVTADGIYNLKTKQHYTFNDESWDSTDVFLTTDSFIHVPSSGVIRYPDGYVEADARIPVKVAASFDGYKYVYYRDAFISSNYKRLNIKTGDIEDSDVMVWTIGEHTISTDKKKIYVDGIPIYQYQTWKMFPLKFDIGSSFGLLNFADDEDTFYLMPITPPTVLNFPSNLHFTVLAYRLAVAMCIVLGKDPSGLAALLQEKNTQLINQSRRNLAKVSKIKNVYTRRIY